MKVPYGSFSVRSGYGKLFIPPLVLPAQAPINISVTNRVLDKAGQRSKSVVAYPGRCDNGANLKKCMAQSLAERRIQGPDIPCDDSHRSEDDREIPADFFNFKEFFYFACQYIKIGSIIDTA